MMLFQTPISRRRSSSTMMVLNFLILCGVGSFPFLHVVPVVEATNSGNSLRASQSASSRSPRTDLEVHKDFNNKIMNTNRRLNIDDVLLNEPPREFEPRKDQLRVPDRSTNNNDDSSSSSTRIINGNGIDGPRYPYYVQMWQQSLCGGALIGPNLVVTAAHCQDAANVVRIGRYNRFGGDGSQNIAIEQKVVHEDYDEEEYPNDIMLLLLKSSTDKQYIRLNANESMPSNNTLLDVVGFGDTDAGNGVTLPTLLQKASLEYVDNHDCQDMHKDDNVTDDMLCAAAPGKDSCGGDSGGPLLSPGIDASDDVLMGLVSWGRGCADVRYPGVYTRISYFYEWIVETACEISDEAPDYFDCPSAAPSAQPSPAPGSGSDNRGIAKQLDFIKWNPNTYPLSECQGDCDNDSHCEGSLVCFQRHAAETQVPGCTGTDAIPDVADFCIEPNVP